MTVVCVPFGRGRWAPLRLQYAGPQLAPFTCRVGELVWRVREVLA